MINKIISLFILLVILAGCVKEENYPIDSESVKILHFDNNEIRFYVKYIINHMEIQKIKWTSPNLKLNIPK